MKTLHENSIAAATEGRKKLFGDREAKIVAALRASFDPLSDREIMTALGYVDPNKVRPRVTELVDAGVLEEVDSITCPISKRTVRRVRVVRREIQAQFDLQAILTPEVRAAVERADS